MIAAVAQQGFALCAARDRSASPVGLPVDPSLEPLLPGFLSASAAMTRVVDADSASAGQRSHRAHHRARAGPARSSSPAPSTSVPFAARRCSCPYNCTTTGRDLADSQLFGHRRGAFTGAVSDQPGLVRSAAGGTLFLDEIGDLPLDVQPKLLRFLEQHEIMPIGETHPQRVDVRVLAATNADLEQRVAEGKFREDLYYRLAVIRIHVPPLRERREEIPHLSTFFLREASERLGKPDIHLSSETLDMFSQFWWPGNVRQLKNEIQRAVALSAPGGHDRAVPPVAGNRQRPDARRRDPHRDRDRARSTASLASAVEQVERDMIQTALDRSRATSLKRPACWASRAVGSTSNFGGWGSTHAPSSTRALRTRFIRSTWILNTQLPPYLDT